MYLTVGGIEPRKGSRYLVEALGMLKAGPGRAPMLAVVGGHSFQDYRAYRDEVLGSLGSHGLRLGDDVVLVGTVPDSELPGWFGAADSFVFPSISEGWGLVVLEALAAGLPVVASDIEVFREFLTHDVDAVLTGAPTLPRWRPAWPGCGTTPSSWTGCAPPGPLRRTATRGPAPPVATWSCTPRPTERAPPLGWAVTAGCR